MSSLSLAHSSGGWSPGTPLTGAPDPTTTANPVDLMTTVKTAAIAVLTSAGGAMLLFMVGLYAVLKGWQWYTAMFRKPRQLKLF